MIASANKHARLIYTTEHHKKITLCVCAYLWQVYLLPKPLTISQACGREVHSLGKPAGNCHLQPPDWDQVSRSEGSKLFSKEDVKETFHTCLDETQSKSPLEDKIILLEDFKAKVGWDQQVRLGIRNINSSGVMLLSKCVQYNLTITNILFHQKCTFREILETTK